MSNSLIYTRSPVEIIIFREKRIFLKRDDLIDRDFSGNKARKFFYFLYKDFPNITKIVSYGSNQSNAMYSLSVLAKLKGWDFEYYVDHIPEYLMQNPIGNYKAALKNGMKIYAGVAPRDCPQDVLFIEEGGRQQEAEYGIKLLAQEILDWQQKNGIKELNIFLPSGTGTTALYLQKSFSLLPPTSYPLPTVYTTPCVGDSEYLKKQFSMLTKDTGNYPVVIEPSKKYHFGKLYREFYEIWVELRENTGVEFDLLYDPLGWLVMMDHLELLGDNVMYIHQGGVLGNESMLPRYLRKFPEFQNSR